MKAAVVTGPAKTPVYGDFTEPNSGSGESKITVTASALNPLTKGRASGRHYSSSAKFPFVAGVDGVGRTQEGKRVYFVLPSAPYGAMAERTIVRTSQCVAIPDGLDDITAAALANPGMSSWAALTERAKFVAGENVLINGATGVAGRLAIQIAKHLGAKKVIATGRNADVLKTLPAFGADAIIPLGQDGESLEKAFKDQFSSGIDVVLDYLWGPSAEHLLIAGAQAAKEAIPIRFVQIGSASSPNVTLPGAVLRSSALQLMGSGLGSVSIDRLAKAIGALLIAAAKHDFKVETQAIPLTQVETAWSMEGAERIVFAIG